MYVIFIVIKYVYIKYTNYINIYNYTKTIYKGLLNAEQCMSIKYRH